MKIHLHVSILRTAFVIVFLANSFQLQALGTWTVIASAAPHTNGGGMMLLSDGTVLVKTFSGGADGYGNTYDKLTPNANGSYVNGTWSSIAPMANTRLYYSSQVLKDGRVYVAGGEYGTGGSAGEVYNPIANSWTSAPAPGTTLSDANSEILEDGRVLQALVSGSLTGTKIYNPATNTYSNGPTALGIHNESAWIKLPDNSILYVNRLSTSSERYIPATNTWIADATVPVQLYDAFGDETGGALLLPDGRALFLGSAGHNAYYTPSGSTAPGIWAAAPDFPNSQGTPDAPAAMMVDGKVLCNASPVPTSANHFPSPTTFYEFDPVLNTFTAISAPGGGATLNVPTYVTNFLDLPDGTVLYSRQNSNTYYVYTPGGSPVAAGKPAVNTLTQTGTFTYQLTGTLFNGISQGATYGDDWQMSTNYPLVRLVSGSNVYYMRTSNWNSTGLRRGSAADTATFTIPSGLPNVAYSLYVVANGIASDPVSFSLTPTAFVSIAVTSGSNPSCTGSSVSFTATPTNGGTTPSYQWKVNGSNVGLNNATYSTTSLTTGQVVSCVMTSNLGGVLGNPATSNSITITVNNPTPAAVSISASATTICAGTSVTFTATPTNGGTAPFYQWKVNGVNAGTNSPIHTTTTLTNGQVVTCVLTSNSNCVTTATATSNSITMTVNGNGVPTLSIGASSSLICSGTNVTFTATATNAGLNPSYQWKINGSNVGNNSNTFSSNTLTNGQQVSCVLISNAACPATATLGTSSTLNAATSDVGAAYPTYYGSGRQQYLIRAAELVALGLSAGNITSIGFNINGTTGDPATLFGYSIKMGQTSSTVSSTTFLSPSFTTVWGPSNYSPVLNSVNTHTFTTPFVWDGASNIIVDICFSNQVTGSIAYQSYQSQTSFVSTTYYQADGAGGSGACAQSSGSGTGSVRPNMILTDATASATTSNLIMMVVNANPSPSISGSASFCSGSSTTLNAGAGYSSYNWSTGATTQSISSSTAGTFTVTVTNANGCSGSTSVSTIVNPLPSVSFSGLSSSYNVGAAAATLTGSPVGGTFSGPGISGNSFTASVAGVGGPYTITYSYSDGNGCSNSSSQQTTVTSCTIAATPGTITTSGGSSKVCPGDTRTYTVAAVSGATSYTWNPPAGGAITSGAGTRSVVINYTAGYIANDTLRVTANNACGSSAQRKLNVVRNAPAIPSTITGLSYGVCNTPNLAYTVTQVTGMTYSWSLSVTAATINSGQGTNSIVASYSSAYSTGVLAVTANNTCGVSPARSLTVRAIPATPASISGPATACANQSGVAYSTVAVTSAVNYTWVVPTGSTIFDGFVTSSGTSLVTTSTAVSVNFGSTSGIVKVRANNSCGSSSYRSLSVTFNCRGINPAGLFDFNVSPNPAMGNTEILFTSKENSRYVIQVMDISGRTVILEEVDAKAGNNRMILNLENISKGIYIIRLANGDQQRTSRLVVQ